MNIQQLKYFCVLAQYEHYTKAADELDIAQSSLSYAISSLEQELGVFLFKKQGRNVILTRQGRQYLYYAEKALDLLEQGSRIVKNSPAFSGNILDIGFVSSVQSRVIQWIQTYQQSCGTGCRFIMHENGTKSLMRDLKNGTLDVVFSSEPENSGEYETHPLFRQEIIVLVPKNHPLAQREFIVPADLNEEAVIMHTEETGMRTIISNLLAFHEIAPFIAGEASEDRVIAREVSIGLGIALMTDCPEIYPENVKAIPLRSPLNFRNIYQTVSKNHYMSKDLILFLDHVGKTHQIYDAP